MSEMTTYVSCESADGWSLHAPGSTDEQIASGDAPALVTGKWLDDRHAIPEAAHEVATRIGWRVRVQPPALAPQTGVGEPGTIMHAFLGDTRISGGNRRYVMYDVRLDTGSLVSHELDELRRIVG